MNFSFKKIVAAFFLIGGTFLMLALGNWQLQRLEWKQNIIKQLKQGYSQAENAPSLSLDDIRYTQENILYGSLTGQLLFDKELLFGPKPNDGEIGYHVITPLKTASGTILVNRGWVKSKQAVEITYPQKSVSVTGTIRKPDWNKFTPNNNPAANVWTKLDIQQIAAFLELQNISSKMIYLDRPIIENDPVIAIHKKWYPRNKHKQYAIFWFSMAFIFLGFFIYYMRSPKKKLS